MPAPIVKNKADEEVWNKAKGIAKSEGHEKDYGYLMGIYAKIKGGKKRKPVNPRAMAAARLVMGSKQGQAAPAGNMQEGE